MESLRQLKKRALLQSQTSSDARIGLDLLSRTSVDVLAAAEDVSLLVEEDEGSVGELVGTDEANMPPSTILLT